MVKKENVTILAEKDFSKFINEKNQLVIVDFFAEWCGPCQMMAPILENVAKKDSNVKIGKLNVDDANSTAGEYEISSIPCIVFFKDGKEVNRIIGAVNEDILREKIRDYV